MKESNTTQEHSKSCWCKNHILIWPPALRHVNIKHLCSLAVKEVYFYSRFNDRKPRIREVIIRPFKALFKYLGIERGQCARKRRSSENISENIKREPNAFCYAGPPGKDIFCKPGLNWCWALENSDPLSSIYGIMGQLGVSLALDHPTSESIFALAVHAQFISFYFWRAISGGKRNIHLFSFLLFFFHPSHLSAWDLQ